MTEISPQYATAGDRIALDAEQATAILYKQAKSAGTLASLNLLRLEQVPMPMAENEEGQEDA